MSSSSGSSACSSTHVLVTDAMRPRLEELKRRLEQRVWVKVMAVRDKVHDLDFTYRNGLVPTRAQRARARKCVREFAVARVTDLVTDHVLLHMMFRKEWHQLEKIRTYESFVNLRIHELTNWITEWQDEVSARINIITTRHFEKDYLGYLNMFDSSLSAGLKSSMPGRRISRACNNMPEPRTSRSQEKMPGP